MGVCDHIFYPVDISDIFFGQGPDKLKFACVKCGAKGELILSEFETEKLRRYIHIGVFQELLTELDYSRIVPESEEPAGTGSSERCYNERN